MNVEKYAKTHGVDAATAMTHLALINLIETATSNKQYQQWMFNMLVEAIDPQKFALAASAWARDLVAMAAAESTAAGS